MSTWTVEHAERLDAMCRDVGIGWDEGIRWDHSANDLKMLAAARDELRRLQDIVETVRSLVENRSDGYDSLASSDFDVLRKAVK